MNLFRPGQLMVEATLYTTRWLLRAKSSRQTTGMCKIYTHICLTDKHHAKLSLRPDFTNTEPAAEIGPFPQWGDPKKIVAMDPWGHIAPFLFKDVINKENGEHH